MKGGAQRLKNLRQNVVKKTFAAVYRSKANPDFATRTVPVEAESIAAAFMIANQDVHEDESEVRVYDDLRLLDAILATPENKPEI